MKNSVAGRKRFLQEVAAQLIAVSHVNRVLMQLSAQTNSGCGNGNVTSRRQAFPLVPLFGYTNCYYNNKIFSPCDGHNTQNTRIEDLMVNIKISLWEITVK